MFEDRPQQRLELLAPMTSPSDGQRTFNRRCGYGTPSHIRATSQWGSFERRSPASTPCCRIDETQGHFLDSSSAKSLPNGATRSISERFRARRPNSATPGCSPLGDRCLSPRASSISDNRITLLKTFAGQAVMAIENWWPPCRAATFGSLPRESGPHSA